MNLSLCQLYTCSLPPAILTLERCLKEAPGEASDALVFDLATLYDLACDGDVAGRKKRVVQEVVRARGLFVVKDSFRL